MCNRARASGGHRASTRVNRSSLNPALCVAVLAAISLGCSSTDAPSEIQISADESPETEIPVEDSLEAEIPTDDSLEAETPVDDSSETEIPADAAMEPEYVRYGDRTTIVEDPACEYTSSIIHESTYSDINPDATVWLAGFESPVHDDIGAVQEYVQPPSPETGGNHPVRPFIGYDLDMDRLEVVVVVDPSEDVDYRQIASELKEITSVVDLRLEKGCHTLDDLDDVKDALMDRQVFSEIGGISGGYSFRIDAKSSTIRIETNRTNQEFIQYFTDRFGSLVSFELMSGSGSGWEPLPLVVEVDRP